MRIMFGVHLRVVLLLLSTFTIIYSCGSKANTAGAVSSSSARIITCPTTTVTAISISSVPAFQPNSISVAVNDIVKWTDNDSTTHTVTSGTPGSINGKFDSGNLTPNATVCVQFLAAGSYAYFCNIHTFMTGIVNVQ